MPKKELKFEEWFDKGPDMATTQFIKDFNEMLDLFPLNASMKQGLKAAILPLVKNVLLDHGAEL